MSELNGVVPTKTYTSASAAHLKAYPIISELMTWLQHYTLVTYLINYLKQAFNVGKPYLAKVPYFIPNVKKLDAFVDDSLLTKFDQIFPAITKLTLSDLTPSSIYASAKTYVYGKYNKLTESLIKSFSSARESSVKMINPYVSPINNKFESLIDSYLPESPKLLKEASQDELTRFYSLTSSAVHKSVPLVTSTKDQVIQLPHEISSHISGVYSEELAASKNSTQAFAKTSRKLSAEAIQSLKPIVDPILTKVGSIKTTTQQKISATGGNAKNYIDGMIAEVKNGMDNGSKTNAPPVTPVVAASA